MRSDTPTSDDLMLNGAPEPRTFTHRSENRADLGRPKMALAAASNSDAYAANAKRTKIACKTCRRKKIKCSGEMPCSNCIQAKDANCVYDDKHMQKPRVHKTGKRVSGVKAIQSMESRLLLLENTLVTISKKLDSIGPAASQGFERDRSGSASKTGVSNSTDPETSSEEEDAASDDDNGQTEDSDIDPVNNISDTEIPAAAKSTGFKEKGAHETQLGREIVNFSGGDKFFGSHSVLSVCSDKSMQWISRALPPDRQQALEAFSKVPYYFFQNSKDFFRKWVDPILITAENKEKILERPLPDNINLVFDLVDNYYADTQTTAAICEQPYIRRLFEIYYGLRKDARRLTSSQLLMLCMATYSSIMVKVDGMSIGILNENPGEERFHNNTAEQLISIQNDLMTSAIFLYQKVCIFGHGIETIQGILMLLDAIECSHMTLNVEFMLLSVAIRFAEDMGLHRPELYSGLAADQVRLRYRIWSLCYQYDVEYCYRTGKPPVINLMDVCDFNIGFPMFLPYPKRFEPPSYCHPFYASSDEMVSFDEAQLRSLKERGGFESLHFYYVLLLSKIRFKAYSKLFSASVNLRTYESVQEVLEDLNNDTWKLSNVMIDEFHPHFHDAPGFYENVSSLDPQTKTLVVSVHLKFFFQLMVNNRIPFMVSTSHNNDKVANFRRIYLRSARAILHICKRLNYSNLLIRNLNWISFFPFAAFLVLMSNCINNSTHPDCIADLELLISVSKYKFGLGTLEPKKSLANHLSKLTMTMGLLELFLIVTIDVVSYKTNNNDYRELAQKRFEALKKAAPALFKIKKSLMPLFRTTLFQIRTPLDNINEPSANSMASGLEQGLDEKSPGENVISQTFTTPQLETYDDMYTQSQSPSFNPALANLMDPIKTEQGKESCPSEDQSTPDLLNGSFSDVCSDEVLASLVNSQMVSLPNFFYDNNLGFQ